MEMSSVIIIIGFAVLYGYIAGISRRLESIAQCLKDILQEVEAMKDNMETDLRGKGIRSDVEDIRGNVERIMHQAEMTESEKHEKNLERISMEAKLKRNHS